MTFKEIKDSVISLSGRRDFINNSTMLNMFVNAAQRFLDGYQETPVSKGEFIYATNTNIIPVPPYREILKVFAYGTDGYYKLDKILSSQTLTELYPLLDDTAVGSPVYYVPTKIVSVNNPILKIYPTPDVSTQFKVVGKFYSPLLVNDEDTSWWSDQYPLVLMQATLYKIETTYRNTEGANDALNAIKDELSIFDKDMAAQEIADDSDLLIMGG